MAFPLAALVAIAAEIVIIKFTLNDLSWKKVSLITVLANVLSTVVGFAIASQLPTGLIPKVVGQGVLSQAIPVPGPEFGRLALYGFGLALVLSILIEFGIWKACLWNSPWKRLLWANVLAHWGSYVISFIIFSLAGGLG